MVLLQIKDKPHTIINIHLLLPS